MFRDTRAKRNILLVNTTLLPAKPALEDILSFVYHELALPADCLVRVNVSELQKCIFLETLDETDLLHMNAANGTPRYRVFSLAGEHYNVKVDTLAQDHMLDVYLHDVPFRIDSQDIRKHMKQYGEVLRERELCWGLTMPFPGTRTGVWLVKMLLNKPIGSIISIKGNKVAVTYCGQQPSSSDAITWSDWIEYRGEYV